MSSLNIPSDLNQYLQSGRQLIFPIENSICGNLVTIDAKNIAIQEIEVNLCDEHYPNIEQLTNGPWGHYYIPSVNLTAKCKNFEPENILLWLPKENLYGTYDPHHSWLGVFPNIKWCDIEANPLPFINSQWQTEETSIATAFDPRGRYDIKYES